MFSVYYGQMNEGPQPDLTPSVAADDALNAKQVSATIHQFPTGEVVDGSQIATEETPLKSSYDAALDRLDTKTSAYNAALETQTAHVVAPEGLALEDDVVAIPETEAAPEGNTAPSTVAEVVPANDAFSAENTATAEGLKSEEKPEATPEAKKSPEVPIDIAGKFAEQFPGLTKESLESIEGFGDLSRGQQKLILENLSQLTIGRIRDEAVDGHEEDVANEKATRVIGGSKLLGRVWVGVRDSFDKKFDIVNRGKKLKQEIQNGGMDEHGKILEKLVSGMKAFGPAVKENEKGEPELELLDTKGMSPELAKVAEVFNKQGNAFSKIPYEWSLETATTEQRKTFAKAKETYELQREVIMGHMKESLGDVGAIQAMAETERIIEGQRFIQTEPDAAKALADIENQSAWTAAMKSVGTERGLYMAGGVVARTAITGVLGVAFAPAAAVGIGAIRGWKRAGDALRDQEIAMRKGEKAPETEKTLQAKARIAELNVAITQMPDGRGKEDLVAELVHLNETLHVDTQKNMVTAARSADEAGASGSRGSAEKINLLMNKLKGNETTTLKDERIASALRQRVAYTKQMISEGKMIFGEGDERLSNQYRLMSSLAQAEMLLATETATDEQGQKVEERLKSWIKRTDEETDDARFNEKLKKAAFAGALGGAFAGVGVFARDIMLWMSGSSNTATGMSVAKLGEMKNALGAKWNSASLTPEAKAALTEKIAASTSGQGAVATGVSSSSGGTFVGGPSGPGGVPPGTGGTEAGGTPYFGKPEDLKDFEYGGGTRSVGIPDDLKALEHGTPGAPRSPIDMNEIDRGNAAGVFSRESLPVHQVKSGDTLSAIFASKFPGANNAAVLQILRGMNQEQLHQLGLTSKNGLPLDPDRIYPGDKIDVNKFAEMLKSKGISTSGGGAHHVVSGGTHAVGHGTGFPRTPGAGSPIDMNEIDRGALGKLVPDEMLGKDNVTEVYVPNSGKVTEVYIPDRAPSATELSEEITQKAATENAEVRRIFTEEAERMSGARAFGPVGTSNRTLADAIELKAGRYPNPAEFEHIRAAQTQGDNVGLNRILSEMQRRSLSDEELRALRVSNNMSPKSFAEATPEQLKNWPGDRAQPAPVSRQDALRAFGDPRQGYGKMAESVREQVGRYPNDREFKAYNNLLQKDPIMAEHLLKFMSIRPLSLEDINHLTRLKAGAVSGEFSQYAEPGGRTARPEAETSYSRPRVIEQNPSGRGAPNAAENYTPRGRSGALEIPEVREYSGNPRVASMLERHNNALNALDRQEADRLASLRRTYDTAVANAQSARARSEMNTDMGTMRRGATVIPNILSGRGGNLGQVILNEGVNRINQGANTTMNNMDALARAEMNYQTEVERAQRMYEGMREVAASRQREEALNLVAQLKAGRR